MTTTRQQIVDALANVTGLIPTDTTPPAPMPGASWPRWVQSRFNGKLHYTVSSEYDVLVVLPAGTLETTVEAAGGLVDEAGEALMKIGTVSYVQPVNIMFQNGESMPGLSFRLIPVNCE